MVIRVDAEPRRRRPSQMRVAAVLSRRPFGVRSTRAVARLAGVSPTTAARALHALARDGIACRRIDEVAEGNVRQLAVWTIEWRSPSWHDIASQVGRVRTESAGQKQHRVEPGVAAAVGRAATPALAALRVPQRLAHLFWNADLSSVDAREHGSYVASRILRADDCQALGWLARHLHPEAIRAAAAGRGLDPRRATLAQVLAATSPTLGGA
jgi:hypothetical protein